MTYANPDAPRSRLERAGRDDEKALETWFGARARRLFGTLALILVVAWLAFAGGRGTTEPTVEQDAAAAQQEQVFDGRGKWTGYAR